MMLETESDDEGSTRPARKPVKWLPWTAWPAGDDRPPLVASMVGGSLATGVLVSGDVCDEFVRASPDCIQVITLDGRLEFINENGLAMLEIEDVFGLAGALWSSLWPEAERDKVDAAVAMAKTGKRERFQGSYPTASGTPKWWDVIVSPVRNSGGEIDALLAVSRDITSMKAVEERLDAALIAASAASKAKDDFLANLSHELRTPLTSILGFTELLSRTIEAPQDQSYLDHIARSGTALLSLLNDLIDLASAGAGALSIEQGPSNLQSMITDLTEILRPAAQDKGIDIELVFDARLAGHLQLDEARVQQVAVNLISNAVKFTTTGVVTVTVQPADDTAETIVVAVTDTGDGIDAAILPTLFDRFTQVDGSFSRRHGGAGLGLAICKELIDLMGGSMGAESTPGEGSTFWFRLPLVPVEGPHTDETEEAPDVGPLAVLVADDNPANRRLLNAVLESGGHSVVLACDGAEALEFAAKHPFDVILMDIQMPIMDGLTALRTLRGGEDLNARTPVLTITANVLPEQIASYLAAGANGCIAKPFNAIVVLEGMAAVVGAARAAAA